MKSALILEDNTEIRAWLAKIVAGAFPGIVLSEAATLTEAMKKALERVFDLALIDINLPDGNGIALVQFLRATSPQTYCVIATIFDNDETIFHALQAGAHGYLLKDYPADQLEACLKRTLSGEPPLSPRVAQRILHHFRLPPPAIAGDGPKLTDRELEMLIMISKGLNRTEIAKALCISTNTVASHISSIYRKLDISSRSEATLEAIRRGLIHP